MKKIHPKSELYKVSTRSGMILSINGDISQWDTSNVTNMYKMFNDSPLEKKYTKMV